MLRFNTPILILAIFACELAIISPAVVAYNDLDVGDISPSAVANDIVASLSTSTEVEAERFEDLYQRCAVILGDECGDEIFDLIFGNNSLIIITDKDMEIIVSKNCCGKLVNMGRHCHDHMVNMIAQTIEFSTHSSAILPRSSQVWELCSLSSY